MTTTTTTAAARSSACPRSRRSGRRRGGRSRPGRANAAGLVRVVCAYNRQPYSSFFLLSPSSSCSGSGVCLCCHALLSRYSMSVFWLHDREHACTHPRLSPRRCLSPHKRGGAVRPRRRQTRPHHRARARAALPPRESGDVPRFKSLARAVVLFGPRFLFGALGRGPRPVRVVVLPPIKSLARPSIR